MDANTAWYVLQNLLERFAESDSKVFLTSGEAKALRVIADTYADLGVASDNSTHTELEAKEYKEIQSASFPIWDKANEELTVCLDFGTSYSKAFACSADDFLLVPKLTALAVGGNDSGVPNLLLPSELFVDDGVIHFGLSARNKFFAVEAKYERLIGSPKQFITLGKDATELDRSVLEKAQEPSQRLTQRDAVVLYLAHLDLLAMNSLSDQGEPTNVKRRYTHPHWNEEIFEKNSLEMRRILAEAITLSQMFPSNLLEKCSLEVALKMLTKVRSAEGNQLPFDMVGDPVLEATAAGAGALMATRKGSRQPYVILDIGAGTTDVAGCVCVHNHNTDQVAVAEVSSAAQAKNMAGNLLDNALLRFMLTKANVVDGTPEYARVQSSLLVSIRDNKEVLFREGSLSVNTPLGDVITASLDEFLEDKVVVKFFEVITELVKKAAFTVAGSSEKVNVVATGGGASLPVVQKLNNMKLESDGKRISLRLQQAMPGAVEDEYPEFADRFAQLAVAVGGSLPNLPKKISSISEGISIPGKRTLAPIYKS